MLLLVSKLGFGCVGLTGTYNAPMSDEDAIVLVKNVFRRGITIFDTADSYGANANEILLVKVIYMTNSLKCTCEIIRYQDYFLLLN